MYIVGKNEVLHYKTKSIFDRLLPEVKSELRASARQYSSAKKLKYVLMSSDGWWELTIDQIRCLYTYGNVREYSYDSVAYGTNIIDKDY